MKKRNRRRIITATLCAAVIASCGIGSLSAYFTDGDTATNEFTVGKVSIDLQEQGYPGDDSSEVTNLVPNEEVKKDPRIKNDGVNDAYVFMEVFVPYANVITANADGSRDQAADTELFSYTVNSGWKELEDSETVDSTKHVKAGYVRHLYAYASGDKMTALTGSDNGGRQKKDGTSSTAGATTPALFDGVRFANIIEDQGLENADLHLIINSYAIQTLAVNNNDTANDGATTTDITHTPESVWDVLETQASDANGSFVSKQNNSFFSHGSENETTDENTDGGVSTEPMTWDDDGDQ